MLYAIMQLITGKRVFGNECNLTNKCSGTMFENVSKVIKVHDFFISESYHSLCGLFERLKTLHVFLHYINF